MNNKTTYLIKIKIILKLLVLFRIYATILLQIATIYPKFCYSCKSLTFE